MPADHDRQGSMQRLGELIERLDEIQREIKALTQDQVDAVLLPDGLPFLLSGAQEALRQHEEEQRAHADQRAAILDALPAKVALLDAAGAIIATNAGWRGAGCDPADTPGVGLNYLEVCDRAEGEGAEYAAASAAGIRQVLAGERGQFSLDYPCASPENPDGWFRLLAAPLPGLERPGAVVAHIDVTAEHLATLQARREERYFRQLFDTNPMPMWLFDTQTLKFLDVNRAAIAHYGYSREQFLGMTIRDIRPADERERLDRFMAASDRAAGDSPTQWRHQRADGSLIDVEIHSDDFELDGRSARLVVAVDVTERMRNRRIKEAEARVLAAISTRESLETILEHVATGIEEIAPDTFASVLLLDPDGRHIRHGAAPSLPEEFNRAVDGLAIGPEVGSCGTAMHHGEAVFVDDIRTDALWRDFADLAEAAGLRACWSWPVFDSNRRVVGTLALYYAEPREPEPWERDLAGLFGALAGLAVERRRQDKALETSERRLKKLFHEAATGIVVITEQGDFEQANGVFAGLVGCPQGRILELNYHDLTHPDDREDVRAAIRRLLSTASSAETLEQRFVAPQGGEAWGRVRFSAQSGKDGHPEHLIGIIEEITQRKQAELRLERASALQRIAGRIGRVGGWSVDLERDEVFWSPEIFNILEWDADEVPPLSDSMELYPPEHRERVQSALSECAESGVPFDIEAELRTRRGRRLQVRVAGEPEKKPSGEVGRVIGVFQDITQQKRVEARRDELAGRLENVLENMSDAFLLIDTDWTINYINRAGEQMVQARRAELLGRNLWAAFPEAQQTEIGEQYEHAMTTGESVHFELYYEPLEHWFEVTAYPSQEGLAVYFSQTTEKRRLEEQLQQSQRLESVGQLTGGIAHDFNNLLTVILGNAELLTEELADSEELAPIARNIGDAAVRGAELTRRLLAFARRQPLAPEPTDVQRLIRGLQNLLQRALGEQCEIEISHGAGLWTAMIDSSQFESALMNLAINARDAMAGGGRLTIEAANVRIDDEYGRQHPDVEPGQYVMVAVSDTGIGIPEESLGKVFEPFFTTKEKGRGTGLGLSMVYGFIKQSRGHIRIYSELDEGTTVRLYLPRAHRAAAPSRAPEVGFGGSRGEAVLIVEDEPAVREFAESVLAQLGYRVGSAASGRQALELLEQGMDCDLLFTDVVMPGGLNGRELAAAAAGLRPDLKVLYTSGYTENAIVHQGRLDPGVHLLSKPYRRDELARRVRKVLDEDPDEPGADHDR